MPDLFCVCVAPFFWGGGGGGCLSMCFVSVLLLDLWEVFKVVAVNRGSGGALNFFVCVCVFCFYL